MQYSLLYSDYKRMNDICQEEKCRPEKGSSDICILVKFMKWNSYLKQCR